MANLRHSDEMILYQISESEGKKPPAVKDLIIPNMINSLIVFNVCYCTLNATHTHTHHFLLYWSLTREQSFLILELYALKLKLLVLRSRRVSCSMIDNSIQTSLVFNACSACYLRHTHTCFQRMSLSKDGRFGSRTLHFGKC